MRREWYRMYYEARTDKKLAMLTDAEHRTWFALMCLAAEPPLWGTTKPMGELELAAEVAKGKVVVLRTTLAKLAPRPSGLDIAETLPDGSVRFLHWRDRQYTYPSDMPEAVGKRVTKHRERECNESETSSNESETSSNESTLRATDSRLQITESSVSESLSLLREHSCPTGANDAPGSDVCELTLTATARPAPTPKNAEPTDFAAFYNAYPKRQKRPDACKAWRSLSAKERHAAKRDVEAGRFSEVEYQYIPLPASYLRSKRWVDELPSRNGDQPLQEEEELTAIPADPAICRSLLNTLSKSTKPAEVRYRALLEEGLAKAQREVSEDG